MKISNFFKLFLNEEDPQQVRLYKERLTECILIQLPKEANKGDLKELLHISQVISDMQKNSAIIIPDSWKISKISVDVSLGVYVKPQD